MKDDTVSRAAVMESLTKEYNRRRTGDGLKLAWIEKAVNDVPEVKTEIIRCKECRYYDGFDCSRYADETFGMTHSTQEYGFCWLAERRTDEQNS